ncbi:MULTISPECIES: ribosomal L7Ae/L30e/S12e/Gadd45 family protein [unclassified Granulicatella]|uniref:L7Ae/L30e/S12e/Gadd45 family ribosomal protein n=1 Tax=unclassified Granulicatella TaxID=2630493 RepID=UPI0010745EDF|nr:MULTISPECIES: ribosomal L7Ae/L30e/S12e/Gadd45 family protein [unclassified Granulicatella]MBF0781085.1 ribosomal L7Ae/L30e/S12e/Gadd45 family protein [Granulicatella sp. 19428wC4_WM01]TFU92145.1 hypothetical protein E4T68_08230 [Granulicatella sp. WM01]
MINEQKQLNLLGLATKAGKLSSGEGKVLDDVRKGKVTLVIIATDCSPATKKKIADKCQHYRVPFIEQFTTMEISFSIGKKRSILGFLDKGFSSSFQQLNQH